MEMIQVDDLVDFICPNCGNIIKGKRGEKIECNKCYPDFKGWFEKTAQLREQEVQDGGNSQSF